MTAAARRKSAALATKTAELALAVPQVVAHRVTRMALAGPTLSVRDRKEFDLMSAEKTAAFQQSWNAMAVQTIKANQALANSLLDAFWLPSSKRKPNAAGLAAQVQTAAVNMTLGVLGKGLAPLHRTAVANAKRLARTKLR